MYKTYNGDCLSIFKDIEDKSVNLVLIDPPYNIGKDKKWDKWKTVDEYVEFMGKVFKECQRVLKDNGSFYFFHNDFLQIVELQNYINNNTDFVFKQLLVWNKRYNGSPRKYYFDNVIKGDTNRNHRQLSEYCLYYTFQDETGLNKIMNDYSNFESIKKYFKEEQSKIEKELRIKIKDKVRWTTHFHWFAQGASWGMCPIDRYKELQKTFPKYFKKPYEDLRQEYEYLRQEYEELRYTFNNQKTHHDVLDFEVAKKQGHITPKPVDLLEYIIKTSSNEGDIILDCFMGSGSTGVACMNTNRKFIGIELNTNYFDIASKRIEEAFFNAQNKEGAINEE